MLNVLSNPSTIQLIISTAVCTCVYLLVGFQFAARVFFWGRTVRDEAADFIVPLVFVLLVWPVLFLNPLFWYALKYWETPYRVHRKTDESYQLS